MPIKTASILVGATVSATGGTALAFTTDAQTVPNGVHVVDAAATDFRTATQITARNFKIPSVDKDGVYSKGRKGMTLVKPKILASGKTVFPLGRVEIEDHPEMTQAEKDELRLETAQMLIDSDFVTFWRVGSTE